MKPTFIILFLFLTLTLKAQYDHKFTYHNAKIAGVITGTTIAGVLIFGNNMSKNQLAISQFSSIGIATGYCIFKSTELGKKIQHRIYLKRNKSINETLICEK